MAGTSWDPAKYGTVKDAKGRTIRFRTRRDAEQAADEETAKVRNGVHRDPAAGRITFGGYVSRWYAAQDLAASTMQNYQHHIEPPVAGVRAHGLVRWDGLTNRRGLG